MATFREAIATLLHEDATLRTLLEYHAVNKARCVFFGFPPEQIDTPLVTYRIAAEQGHLPRSIFVDVIAWGDNYGAVLDRVQDVLHKKREITATDYSVKGLLYESSGAELYDTDLKCYYQRARYRGVVVKT
jgi:hypothetical protein